MILIFDFGSQTTHLIGRRIRDMGVETAIETPDNALKKAEQLKPKGMILSGGPSSVYGKEALLIDPAIFRLPIPILGICYGLQLCAYLLGGKVDKGKKKEYGPAVFYREGESSLFSKTPDRIKVWMSHFDEVVKPPRGAKITGRTDTVRVGAYELKDRKIYGVQFHPEVHHTQNGTRILSNFIFRICHESKSDRRPDIRNMILKLKREIVDKKAVVALSGGIDSAVAAVLASKAIGDRLTCFYVDTGLMREGETEEVEKIFRENFSLNLKTIRAKREFLRELKGATDPEEKRRIIGNTFIRIFEKYAAREKTKILIQGTIYPDVIESKGSKFSVKIKTHHNVGGLPEKHSFRIVEPLKSLYKDEVRQIARNLGFPQRLIHRHVFPGPGLAVRIIGEVTEERLAILRKCDKIVEEEIKKSGLHDKIWMSFAVLTGVKTTGVTGDERKYGETVAVRALKSKDTMTADWVRLPYKVLAKISSRITTEVFETVRVVYDITPKPPSTMEWE